MKIFTFLITLIVFTNSFSQDKNIARVHKVNGIEAYILAEPLREYEVVFGGDNKIQWTSFLTGGIINSSIETKVSKFIKAVQEKSEEEGIKFDAVVYTDGKNVSAIKFTDEKTDENYRMAEVQKMSGIPLFVLSDPVLDYTVEYDKGGGIKWKSLVTAGLINNSIEQDVSKFVNKFEGKFKKDKIDAIHYTNGKEADGILFR